MKNSNCATPTRNMVTNTLNIPTFIIHSAICMVYILTRIAA